MVLRGEVQPVADLDQREVGRQERQEAQLGRRERGDAAAFGWHPYLRLPDAPRSRWRLGLPSRTHLALDGHGIPTGVEAAAPHEAERIGGRTFRRAGRRSTGETRRELQRRLLDRRRSTWMKPVTDGGIMRWRPGR
jgi:hypothetical protein